MVSSMNLIVWMKLAVLFLVCFIFGISRGQTEASVCSQEDKNKIDLTFSRLGLLAGSRHKLPENLEQLPKFCNDTKRFLAQIKDYNNKCSARNAKILASVLLYKINESLKELCSKRTDKNWLTTRFEAFKCGNAARKVIKRCNLNLIDSMEAIPTLEVNWDKRPTLCCEYDRMRNCYFNRGATVAEWINSIN